MAVPLGKPLVSLARTTLTPTLSRQREREKYQTFSLWERVG